MAQEDKKTGLDASRRGSAPLIATEGHADEESAETISILFVDDERQLLSVLSSKLEAEIDSLEVVTASHATQALERLEQLDIDCVVSDYRMPGMDGLELLEKCREYDPDIPFILFTSQGSEDVATKAINAGVTDYLQKNVGDDRIKLLANRIENAVLRYRTTAESREIYQHIQRIHDRISDAFLGMDHSWTITYVDQQGAELLQRPREDLLGANFWTVFPEATDTPFKKNYERAIETGEPVDFEAYHEPFDTWFEVRAFPSEDGLSVYFRDVSERKELESTLETHRSALSELYDTVERLDTVADELLTGTRTARDNCDCDSAETLDDTVASALELTELLADLESELMDGSRTATDAGEVTSPNGDADRT